MMGRARGQTQNTAAYPLRQSSSMILHHPHTVKDRAPKELTLDAGRECGPVHTVRYAVGQNEQCYQ